MPAMKGHHLDDASGPGLGRGFGAAAGGVAAIVVFVIVSFWSARNLATPQADQATALFGNFAIGLSGYAGVALIVLVVGVLTAATSHATVVAYLTDIETRQTD